MGMVCLGLDRRCLKDEVAGLAGFGGLVGFEDGSVVQAWWWELAGCLVVPGWDDSLLVGVCLVDRYPVGVCLVDRCLVAVPG